MSHYSVLVIHDENTSIDELLEPYDEKIKVAPYQVFTRQEGIYHVRKHWSGLDNASDEECVERLEKCYEVDLDGNFYDTYNPKSKWDWYQVGGCFENTLQLKNGTKTDSAKLKELNFSPDEELYRKALRFWDVVVDNKPLEPGEEKPLMFYKPEYYIKGYGNRETYAKAVSTPYTYAVLMSDGIWHEPGKMGWWGMSAATPEQEALWVRSFHEKFLKNLNPELVLTVVDCHI